MKNIKVSVEDKIEYIKRESKLFNRQMLIIIPLYTNSQPTERDYSDPFIDDVTFEFDMIDIDKEFDHFENLYFQVCTTSKEVTSSLDSFNYYLKNKLGFVQESDEDTSYFEWSELVSYNMDLKYGDRNYWTYYRNDGAGENEDDHIVKGFDEKVKLMVTKALSLLLDKFNNFRDKIEGELYFDIKPDDYINIANTNGIEKIDEETKKDMERIKKAFIDLIDSCHNKKWEYIFITETDYHSFTNKLVLILTKQPCELPTEVIKLQNNCKTLFAKLLNDIYKNAATNENLNKNIKYLSLIKKLSHFENIPIENIPATLRK